MAESNQKTNKIGIAAGGMGAVMLSLAQTKPEDAISNLAGWLKLVGFDTVPAFLATPQADNWGTATGIVLLVFSVSWWLWKRFDPARLKTSQAKTNAAVGEADKERAIREEREAATSDCAFDDMVSDRVPFTRIRHIANEFRINLTDVNASNTAYEIEGAMRQAAVDDRLKVWGRKYHGAVQNNDPMLGIPRDHFEDFGFRHGSLHHQTPNDKSATGLEGQDGITFYDLQLSYADARKVLDQVSKERLNEQT